MDQAGWIVECEVKSVKCGGGCGFCGLLCAGCDVWIVVWGLLCVVCGVMVVDSYVQPNLVTVF